MYDYKLLEALAMVVRHGGFERAARAMFLTQSAVSQRIKQLEEELGQTLVVRTVPPRATAAGRALLRHVQQVQLLEQALADELVPAGTHGPARLPIAVNADSLATWLIDALAPLLEADRMRFELRVLDEERTHELLRDGEVVGCVSARSRPVQGCRMTAIGRIRYRLCATEDFRDRWLPEGLTAEAVARAPLVAFHRDDVLHRTLLGELLDEVPPTRPHFVPSFEQGCTLVRRGMAFGMLADAQGERLRASGELVDLAPGHVVDVPLYWHCWNVRSPLLGELTEALTARELQGA